MERVKERIHKDYKIIFVIFIISILVFGALSMYTKIQNREFSTMLWLIPIAPVFAAVMRAIVGPTHHKKHHSVPHEPTAEYRAGESIFLED